MTDLYVTGASGVLGAEIALHFTRQDTMRVKAVSRRPCPLLPLHHPAQVQTQAVYDAAWFDADHHAATIVHCAGMSDPRLEFQSFSTLAQEQILPHVTMVEALLARGWRGRLIYFSSGGTVYGNALHLPISETHPTSPVSFYGLHKLCIERALEHLARTRGFELIILRVSNPYGGALAKPNQGVIPILVDAFLKDQPFKILGDGSAQRDYLEITDLCRAVECCIRHRLDDPVLTLNIGSGEGTTLTALIKLIGGLLNRPLRTRHVPSVHDVQSNVLCPRRAWEVLGWRAAVTLPVGVDRYLARLRTLVD